eukprot:gnl/TRDRNA2_/TRDRNA2_90888_c0_seq1.p1 gnl/TRDRNA2_/TRDRNA2_90888_c0~~gnl/TRDRNA2_/TRDRNA2_90888_c0_seq1.p1  ORF type:complete len:616 (-),score=56.22 gnl/TRDRNA2_/TRDRNA2_90888_c0_seq1:77-1924(-)
MASYSWWLSLVYTALWMSTAGSGTRLAMSMSPTWMAVAVTVALPDPTFAFGYFRDRIPNGYKVYVGSTAWPAVGHSAPSPMHECMGSFWRNEFGNDFARVGFVWTRELCMEDSDQDGRTNGQELGDPHCLFGTPAWEKWARGHPNTKVSHPGWRRSAHWAGDSATCELQRVSAQTRYLESGQVVELLWSGQTGAVARALNGSQVLVQLSAEDDEEDDEENVVRPYPRMWLVAPHTAQAAQNYSYVGELAPPDALLTANGDNAAVLCAQWYLSKLHDASCSFKGPHARIRWPVAECVFVFVNILVPIWATCYWWRLRRTGRWKHVSVWAIWAMVFLISQIGISVGFHRYFTHRSFETSYPVEWSLALIGQLAMQGDAFYWSALHRTHHWHCDAAGDPHSPHLGGFFHSHGGFTWNNGSYNFKYREVTPDLFETADSDWVKDQGLLSLVGLPLLSHLVFGTRRTVFYLHVPQFLAWHVTELINSVCHLWGYSPFYRDAMSHSCISKNSAWLWALVYGEVWHNNHHAMPSSANFGVSPWELDPAYWLVRMLARLGLVWEVRHELRDPDVLPSNFESLKVLGSLLLLIGGLRCSDRLINGGRHSGICLPWLLHDERRKL